MKKTLGTIAIWFAAFVLTVLLAGFQRMTGPSYPMRGTADLAGEVFDYRLPRTHGGAGGLEVEISPPAADADAILEWRRYPTNDDWQSIPMSATDERVLSATIPHQPPAGKVEYRIVVNASAGSVELPVGDPPVARFRAAVPAGVLIPHILAMFTSMLVTTRALLEVLRPSSPDPRWSVLIAMGLLVVGGLILGPIVQKFAFGAFWTGWPNGSDLTDNKTLVAFLAWLPATVLALRKKKLLPAVVVGWIVMMGVFLIPHSMRGSEMDWSAGEVKTGEVRSLGEDPRRV